jgi:hypothetical protein
MSWAAAQGSLRASHPIPPPHPAPPPPLSHQPAELAELRGTAAADKLAGRVQHPGDAPTRVEELFRELVVPFVGEHEAIAKVGRQLCRVGPGSKLCS